MKKRALIRRLLRGKKPADAPPDQQEVSLAVRLANRIAAVVYPTNSSGNNMSVR